MQIDNDILLIADEVMTGFGRVGEDFASNLYNLKPDILVAGKGMGGGYAAIGGTYSTDEIADSIMAAGYEVMFHTFAALPQSCAASSADCAYATEIKGNIKLTPVKVNKILKP